MTARVLFAGVSTSGSSAGRVWPKWAEVLGIAATLEGRDLPIGAPAPVYRDLVEEIRDDDTIAGAVITTHKVNVFRHAGSLFAALDDWARRCGEVSSIAKRKGVLTGGAIDPVSSGRVLEEMLGAGYWDRTGAHALVLGSDDAGVAIAVSLLAGVGTPARVVVVDRDRARIRALEELSAKWPDASRIECVHAGVPWQLAELIARLPEGSLVVNATGAGKDTPGSPIGDAIRWPLRGVVWELNYRGSLEFLAVARRDEGAARLHIYDGWRLFVHGWTEGLVRIFGMKFSSDLLRKMVEAAQPFAPEVR